jgi:hypothetical protein
MAKKLEAVAKKRGVEDVRHAYCVLGGVLQRVGWRTETSQVPVGCRAHPEQARRPLGEVSSLPTRPHHRGQAVD